MDWGPLDFFFSLEKWFFTDYDKILAWAKKYANAEEAIAARKDITFSQAKKKEKRRREEPFDRGQTVQPKSYSWLSYQRFHKCTPLSIP